MNPKNPFIVTGYRGREYFCDRIIETRSIISSLENERNVTLMAPRRYGKTGLIKNVLEEMSDEYTKIYFDIYATTNLREFTQSFAKAVLGTLDTNVERTLNAMGRFFSRLRPNVTPDASGNVSFSFSLEDRDAEQTLKGVFDYIASKERSVIIAIDEFQQIQSYPEVGTEALLRSYIQFAENAHFIFAGSQPRLMGEMFTSPRHPFYQSTDLLALDVIPLQSYSDFAANWFVGDKRSFSREAFAVLYARFNGITWYIQSALNRIWGEGDGLRNTAQVDSVIETLVELRSLTFHDLLTAQTESGRSLLKAIAKDKVVKEITGDPFILRNKLTAASSVRSTLDSLIKHDLVYRSNDGYMIYDLLFAEYLRHF